MSKGTITFLAGLGGIVGGYVPLLFGQDEFSIWTVVGSVVGGILGIYIAVKISR